MNKGKLAAIGLALALCAGAPVLAAETAGPGEVCAERLSALGVFMGTGAGFELERAPQQIEGVVMLVRLAGAEEEALEMADGALPFTDVPGWARGYAAYAWETGLGGDGAETSFDAETPLEAERFAAYLLQCLHYSEGAEGEFAPGGAVAFAASQGVFDDGLTQTLQKEPFTRALMARMSCAALETVGKGASQPLAEELMLDGKLEEGAVRAFLRPLEKHPSEIPVYPA